MKIVQTRLKKTTAREITSKGASTRVKRSRDADGKLLSYHVIDLSSETIDRDLTYVFGRNVARARAENKKVIGSADGQPAKR
ncbi:MAG: hypothetical protein H0W65_10935 [Sphingomonas sp.]|uniref:hypothetical protein n=1 Tax=Sphingomonas sp. TaxID=28214 RepID=UPI0018391E80|nr:hypothetical protein [Sphingomonas sp.]MBA3668216.1 hypothetical protein [Sphingomonas sp.]